MLYGVRYTRCSCNLGRKDVEAHVRVVLLFHCILFRTWPTSVPRQPIYVLILLSGHRVHHLRMHTVVSVLVYTKGALFAPKALKGMRRLPCSPERGDDLPMISATTFRSLIAAAVFAHARSSCHHLDPASMQGAISPPIWGPLAPLLPMILGSDLQIDVTASPPRS